MRRSLRFLLPLVGLLLLLGNRAGATAGSYWFPIYCTAQPSTSQVTYTSFTNPIIAYDTVESDTENVIGGSAAWTVDQWSFTLTNPPGAGASWTFVVRDNETNTAMTVTISGAVQLTATYSGGISFIPGHRYTIRSTPSSMPAPAATGDMQRMWRVTGTGQMMTTPSTSTHTVAINSSGWMSPDQRGNQTSITPATFPWAAAGTVSNCYFDVTPAPGGTATVTATLYKNGNPTSITCTVTGAATAANDTVHSVPIAAGDLLVWQIDNVGGVTIRPRVGAQFVPYVTGQIVYQCEGGCGNGTTFYLAGEASTTINGIESKSMTMPQCVVGSLFVYNAVGPGTNGGNLTYTARKNKAADTSVTCKMFPPVIVGNTGATGAQFALGDTLDWSMLGSGSGSTSRMSFIMSFDQGSRRTTENPRQGSRGAMLLHKSILDYINTHDLTPIREASKCFAR